MRLWLDAQLSPTLARWLEERFEVEVLAVQTDPSFLSAEDAEIFYAARVAEAPWRCRSPEECSLGTRPK